MFGQHQTFEMIYLCFIRVSLFGKLVFGCEQQAHNTFIFSLFSGMTVSYGYALFNLER